MMQFRRHRLVSLAALTAYMVVHIGAGSLHQHHHGAAMRPGKVPAACGTDLRFLTTGQASEEDEEETCLLCSVLHLAQTPPGKLHVEVLIVLTGEAFSAAAIIQPYPLEPPTHARAPPLV
jgi:hypothetical protein